MAGRPQQTNPTGIQMKNLQPLFPAVKWEIDLILKTLQLLLGHILCIGDLYLLVVVEVEVGGG
jgi:hypothetical protein